MRFPFITARSKIQRSILLRISVLLHHLQLFLLPFLSHTLFSQICLSIIACAQTWKLWWILQSHLSTLLCLLSLLCSLTPPPFISSHLSHQQNIPCSRTSQSPHLSPQKLMVSIRAFLMCHSLWRAVCLRAGQRLYPLTWYLLIPITHMSKMKLLLSSVITLCLVYAVAQQSSGGVFQSMALLWLGSGVGELVLSVFF